MTETTAKLAEELEFFLKSFRGPGREFKYRARISQMASQGTRSIVVDYEDLAKHDMEIAERIINEPDPILRAFRDALYATLRV